MCGLDSSVERQWQFGGIVDAMAHWQHDTVLAALKGGEVLTIDVKNDSAVSLLKTAARIR